MVKQMKIYQWSKISTRYNNSINCDQHTYISSQDTVIGELYHIAPNMMWGFFKSGSIWATKIRNKTVLTAIKKLLWAFITKFPDFSLTFPHPKIFPDFSQNFLTFPWPWKIKNFPDFSLIAGNPDLYLVCMALVGTLVWPWSAWMWSSLCSTSPKVLFSPQVLP